MALPPALSSWDTAEVSFELSLHTEALFPATRLQSRAGFLFESIQAISDVLNGHGINFRVSAVIELLEESS